MPLSKLQFRPGINRESTTYSNEGGYYECNKVRFRSGFPEKIGGWVRQSLYTFKGVVHSLLNWVTFAGESLLTVGTNQKYYIEYGGQYFDITPLLGTTDLDTDPISTTSGSKIVTITDATFASTVGSFVTFDGAATVGGLTIDGEYEILSTPSATTYTIAAATAASSTDTGGGSSVTAEYQVPAGGSTYTYGVGWGAGPWGVGGWGEAYTGATTLGTQLLIWSQSTYGEDLIFSPINGPIYYWNTDTTTFARGILLSDKANTLTKPNVTGGVVTFLDDATTITVTDPTGISPGSVIAGTGIDTGTYVTDSYNGGTSVPISAATTNGSSGSYTFSYSGRAVPFQTSFVIVSDLSPFVIALGANPYDPADLTNTFDPLLVRWSDQDNAFEWVPEATNQAGEQRLNNGSYLVCGANTRQEILIWTDTALYSMQYLGPPNYWGFNLLSDNISIASPRSAITVNNMTYWMGTDKFYQYSGRVETLPCTLRQFVFTNINKDQLFQVVCGTNDAYNEIWWHYPTADSRINNRYVIYNYLERIWYYGTMNRTAWLDSPLRQYPMGAFSVQNTYLSADIAADATTIPVLNASSFPTDAASYPRYPTLKIGNEEITYTGINGNTFEGCVRGANNTTAASHLTYTPVEFKIQNQIMNHEYGNDDMSGDEPMALDSYIGSSDFDIGDGHNFGFVWRILPDVTFLNSTAEHPQAILKLYPRQNSGTQYVGDSTSDVELTAVTQAPCPCEAPVESYTGEVFVRLRGRQMKFRLASETLGVAWQMGSMRIDIRPDGRR